ncbi:MULTISPECIES: hypothetical protein [unclassified Anabaena]|uniref:hypothetical protein n=1 Tax=unclassified Anabaena TaxID=2619674 RepID=UPI002B1F0FFB|nr:hypothetical protein [Anabaena sp. UHCC 0399]MEA5569021.1 hypothetical protein [Anabaena sp. UHCC 0399]
MLNRKIILASLVTWGLMFSLANNQALAEINHNHEVSTTQFRQIEQSLPIKAAVTIGGLGLIGLELWWFILSKPKS